MVALFRFRQARQAELIPEYRWSHLFDAAFVERVEREWPIRDPNESADAVSEVIHDTPDLPVLAFLEGDGEPGIARGLPIKLGQYPTIGYTINRDPILEGVEFRAVNLAPNPHPVFPCPSRIGKLEMPGKIAVIGQKDKAFGIKIKPTDADEPGQIIGQMFKNGLPPLFVPVADNQPTRFVIAPQARRVGRADRVAVDTDFIIGRHV